ncbi:MAG: alkaline phosphatase family protein [Pseudomonadota bacterium]
MALGALLAALGACRAAGPPASPTGGAGGATVVLFLIDGLMADAARTAADNGAANIQLVIDRGVTVQTVHSTSPAARLALPDGSLPWGNATSGNVAVHTGTHVFESDSRGMDDIFTAARAGGIRSVFAGGDANYAAFTTADFHTAGPLTDDVVVQNAIDHLTNDRVRLIRLHLQRVRDDWTGPADMTNPASAYIQHVIADDALLGRLIQALQNAGVWDHTYLIIAADHGMGQTAASEHPPSTASSWDPFLAFYGPGLKAGATIPYAELPDVAVTAMRFLQLPPLRGHLAAPSGLAHPGATGTVLANLFAGAPDDIPHPRAIESYLKLNTFPGSGDAYAPYRTAIMTLLP